MGERLLTTTRATAQGNARRDFPGAEHGGEGAWLPRAGREQNLQGARAGFGRRPLGALSRRRLTAAAGLSDRVRGSRRSAAAASTSSSPPQIRIDGYGQRGPVVAGLQVYEMCAGIFMVEMTKARAPPVLLFSLTTPHTMCPNAAAGEMFLGL